MPFYLKFPVNWVENLFAPFIALSLLHPNSWQWSVSNGVAKKRRRCTVVIDFWFLRDVSEGRWFSSGLWVLIFIVIVRKGRMLICQWDFYPFNFVLTFLIISEYSGLSKAEINRWEPAVLVFTLACDTFLSIWKTEIRIPYNFSLHTIFSILLRRQLCSNILNLVCAR